MAKDAENGREREFEYESYPDPAAVLDGTRAGAIVKAQQAQRWLDRINALMVEAEVGHVDDRPDLTRMQVSDPAGLEAVARAWEAVSGHDSIDTIRRVYPRVSDGEWGGFLAGAYQCSRPGCRWARRDAAVLWRHVHTAHGVDTLPPPGLSGNALSQRGALLRSV